MRQRNTLRGKTIIVTADYPSVAHESSNCSHEASVKIAEALSRLVPAILDAGGIVGIVGYTCFTPLIIHLCNLYAGSRSWESDHESFPSFQPSALYIWEVEQRAEQIQRIRFAIGANQHVRVFVVPRIDPTKEFDDVGRRLFLLWETAFESLKQSRLAHVVVGGGSSEVVLDEPLSFPFSYFGRVYTYPLRDTGGVAKELAIRPSSRRVVSFEDEIGEDLRAFYAEVRQQLGETLSPELEVILNEAERQQSAPYSEIAARIIDHFSRQSE